jgi:hypothetical protein
MTKDECATLLALVSSLDRQPVDEGIIEMWWRMLKDFSFEECDAAIVPAYQEMRGDYMSSKDVWMIVKRVRSQPVKRQWVKDLHDINEHFECRPGEFGHPRLEVEA